MAKQENKGIPLGKRWDMQEAMLLDGALPKATIPTKVSRPRHAMNAISPKTNELLHKLKGKR